MNNIDPARIKYLNDKPLRDGGFVLYWMQHSQRSSDNHALEYALDQANRIKQNVLVLFVLTGDYPEGAARHYRFMLEGLKDVRDGLARRGIKFVIRLGDPPRVAAETAVRASLIVTDRGYLRHLRGWRKSIAESAECRVVQVESDIVVPVESASQKREYAARTIRKKIMSEADGFGRLPVRTEPVRQSPNVQESGIDPDSIEELFTAADPPEYPGSAASFFRGGEKEAEARLEEFISRKLGSYGENRNDPSLDGTSRLSPYLHFGQISPIRIFRAVLDSGAGPDAEKFIDELVVRRELGINYVYYEPDYDSYRALPGWARETLTAHQLDRRDHIYSVEELEKAETHDVYWNAAEKEMTITGFMHNYMRMYWGKKILEWTPDPEEAFKRILYLNNKYLLDGRDPSSYAGAGWVFGLHDRPWNQRTVFGKVRSMTASGLKRKFNIDEYAAKKLAF